MEKRIEEDPFYEYSSIDGDSFSQNNQPENSHISENTPDLNSQSDTQKLFSVKLSPELIYKLNNAMSKEKFSIEDHSDFKGNYRMIIKSQLGGRIIQELLSKTSHCIILDIFEELKYDLADYYKDTYSNYFMQKLYYYLNTENLTLTSQHCKIEYLEILFKDLVDVSSNRIGTFAIQKLMDTFQSDPELEVVLACLTSMPETELMNMAYVSYKLTLE